MRPLYFLFPKLDIQSGGHIAQYNFMLSAKKFCDVYAVTYEERTQGALYIDDEIIKTTTNAIFIIHWGPHVQSLAARLHSKNIVYIAHSTGWKIQLPNSVPIIAVSKHTQAFWGKHAPNSPIFHLPNIIADNYKNTHGQRTIDVLVQKRKSSDYLINSLVPELRKYCNVYVMDTWEDDLAITFNKAKVYLYDSTDHWGKSGVSEGFGLPPLEAMACGCTVFSSINDALSDYLDPLFNSEKLRVYSTEYDVSRIIRAVQNFDGIDMPEPHFFYQYSEPNVRKRFQKIISEINVFFDLTEGKPSNLPTTLTDSKLTTALAKLQKRVKNKYRKLFGR